MKKLVISIPFILFYFFSQAQIANNKYFIEFTDKDNSPYSLDEPSEYLSQRAIDRRTTQGIEIDSKDLPCNPSYIQGVADIGVSIINPTKWLNGVTIWTNDPAKLVQVGNLPYVKSVLKAMSRYSNPDFKKTFFANEENLAINLKNVAAPGSGASFDYGNAYNQIHMLRGDELHDLGYTGEGMQIAVIDAGFSGSDTIAAFDSLRMNGQILGSWDFVARGPITFDQHGHGTSVLSTIGANVPGEMVGTAPHASFYLLRAEDGFSENLIEEYNWVSAAEYADSAGADVINSSLGYYVFDETSAFDHTYEDMDGNTTAITIGADVAASRGMIVCNSIGNEGNDDWYYLIAPSDGDSVVAVGAVDGANNYADFSSKGPSYDGRVKPNVVAQGSGTWVAYPQGFFAPSGGTSFSSPITAGMMACLWQANMEMNNMEIISAAQESADTYDNPSDTLGYGLPDYMKANEILAIFESNYTVLDEEISLFPNPFTEQLIIVFEGSSQGAYIIEIHDVYGRLLIHKEHSSASNTVSINGMDQFAKGVYVVCITKDKQSKSMKVVKY